VQDIKTVKNPIVKVCPKSDSKINSKIARNRVQVIDNKNNMSKVSLDDVINADKVKTELDQEVQNVNTTTENEENKKIVFKRKTRPQTSFAKINKRLDSLEPLIKNAPKSEKGNHFKFLVEKSLKNDFAEVDHMKIDNKKLTHDLYKLYDIKDDKQFLKTILANKNLSNFFDAQ